MGRVSASSRKVPDSVTKRRSGPVQGSGHLHQYPPLAQAATAAQSAKNDGRSAGAPAPPALLLRNRPQPDQA